MRGTAISDEAAKSSRTIKRDINTHNRTMGQDLMREGFYRLEFQGEQGLGCGILALDTGMVVGADTGGVEYDGEYAWSEKKELLDVDVTVRVPEGTRTVLGKIAPSGGMEFRARCSFPRRPDHQVVQAETDHGTALVRIHLLRAFT